MHESTNKSAQGEKKIGKTENLSQEGDYSLHPQRSSMRNNSIVQRQLFLSKEDVQKSSKPCEKASNFQSISRTLSKMFKSLNKIPELECWFQA